MGPDEDKKHEQNEAAVELHAKDADENDRTVVHHIPEDEQLTEYVLKVLEEATQYIELSVLAVDHGLADALRERLKGGDISSSVRMTTVYDPTMIEGLERDAVLVIGPFMPSNQGEFPFFYSNTDDTSTEEAQFHRLNQHVHVALSRAKLASTILTYEPRSDGGSQVIEDPKNNIGCVNIRIQSRLGALNMKRRGPQPPSKRPRPTCRCILRRNSTH